MNLRNVGSNVFCEGLNRLQKYTANWLVKCCDIFCLPSIATKHSCNNHGNIKKLRKSKHFTITPDQILTNETQDHRQKTILVSIKRQCYMQYEQMCNIWFIQGPL